MKLGLTLTYGEYSGIFCTQYICLYIYIYIQIVDNIIADYNIITWELVTLHLVRMPIYCLVYIYICINNIKVLDQINSCLIININHDLRNKVLSETL